MAATKKKSCVICKFAQWTLTPKGRVKKGVAGECVYPLPELPELPQCVIAYPMRRYAIWHNEGESCPTFQPQPE